ncbi:hypothetical protein APHCRT_0669 [Anaplasma phagocytophilum str. CRT53-1]|uniref:Uncharacterized protein n=1 Tax=Anaplasma phagocytophilum str. CRT53-1 TaxID=1359157 RepID=A0A0F3Q1B4_ANAPH|nr:hypothetical protein APHCRT_0669 [Anaplasma phagocytophilum str. CRT53-1]
MVPFTWSKAAKKVYPSALQCIASSTSYSISKYFIYALLSGCGVVSVVIFERSYHLVVYHCKLP